MADAKTTIQIATFGAGCFWGVEETFRQMPGVLETQVGYAGGHKDKPTYQEVCTDETGHAEVVQVKFDPSKISFEKLAENFFEMHDPTQLNRQGPDTGTQYRSAIFIHSSEQKKSAQALIEKLTREKRFAKPIVTTLEPEAHFWPAEEYHQKYLQKRGISHCGL